MENPPEKHNQCKFKKCEIRAKVKAFKEKGEITSSGSSGA